jgi:hypothetical protein
VSAHLAWICERFSHLPVGGASVTCARCGVVLVGEDSEGAGEPLVLQEAQAR